MKIAAGKSYRTREGRIVGPLTVAPEGKWAPGFEFEVVEPRPEGVPALAWKADGSYSRFACEHRLDLVSEVSDEPVNVAPYTLSIVGTKAEVIDAFFDLSTSRQEAVLGALLDRVSGRSGTI
jgi:hypothetical protein